MGSAVPCSEARLHSAERVYMEVHPGLARSRTAQRNVPHRVRGEPQEKTTLFSCSRAVVAGKSSPRRKPRPTVRLTMSPTITELLQSHHGGDRAAFDRLMPLV